MCDIRVLGILLESALDRPNAGKNIDLHGNAPDKQKTGPAFNQRNQRF
jgi:hypothetical protein